MVYGSGYNILFVRRRHILEINVSQLLKSGLGATRNYHIDDDVDITGEGKPSRVEGEVKLTRTDLGVLVTGTLRTDVEVPCSRCLTEFRLPLTLKIEEEYFPTIDVNSGVAVEVPEEPGCFTIDEHHILDLTEAVRQYALTAIPIQTLCKAECAGLCPVCGQNLNEKQCGHQHKEADQRWAKLLELQSSEKEKRNSR